MAIALNMTVPLKQDTESQQKLQGLIAGFADHVQPAIDPRAFWLGDCALRACW